MLKMLSVLWRPDSDLLYTLQSNTTPEEADTGKQIKLVAGRLYRGIPYSYAYCTESSFLDFASEQDENGIYTISGLNWQLLSNGSTHARMGNDCSSTFVTAWSQFGTSVTGTLSRRFGTEHGFIAVGPYTPAESYEDTYSSETIAKNGPQVMFESYAQLQKADALMRINKTSNHVMMVKDVHVFYKEDGSIDYKSSYVITLEQTSTRIKNQTADGKHEVTGEPIYPISYIENVYSFRSLLEDSYIPLTCKELIDPSPVAPPEVLDSESNHSKDTLLTGVISCNWFIDTVTITVSDNQGNEIQQATNTAKRMNPREFDLQQFVTDKPECVRGSIDPTALASGNYHCTVVCRLTTGEEFTVRDFDFTV